MQCWMAPRKEKKRFALLLWRSVATGRVQENLQRVDWIANL